MQVKQKRGKQKSEQKQRHQNDSIEEKEPKENVRTNAPNGGHDIPVSRKLELSEYRLYGSL